MRNKLSRVLAMILAATMTVNTLPMSVFATTFGSPSDDAPPVSDEFDDSDDEDLDDEDLDDEELDDEDADDSKKDESGYGVAPTALDDSDTVDVSDYDLEDLEYALEKAKTYIDELTVEQAGKGEGYNDPDYVVKNFETHFSWDNEKRESANKGNLYDWSYYNGVVFEGLEYVYEVLGEDAYKDYVIEYMSSLINSDGSWATCSNNSGKTCSGYDAGHGVDSFKTASLLLDAYDMTGDSRYLTRAEKVYADLDTAAEGNLISEAGNNYHHKWSSHESYHLWLDGLYMVLPFRAEYAKLIGDTAELDLIVDRMQWVSDNMYDEEEGLFYHAAVTSSNGKYNTSANSNTFWLRSIGWYAAAIVDVMDSMEGENLETMKVQLKKLVDGMWETQNEKNGMWLNNMKAAYVAGTNPYETSGTALVCYAVMKAVNEGWLDESYAEMAELAFMGICTGKLEGSTLKDICLKGAPTSSNSTIVSNEGKGVGPFIMFYAEMYEYLHGSVSKPEVPEEPEVPEIDVVEDTVIEGITGEVTKGDVSEEDKVLLEEKVSKNLYKAYIALDVSANLAEGETATVTVPVPAAWADKTDRIVGISVEDGVVKEIAGTVSEDKTTFSFPVTHFSAKGIALAAERIVAAEGVKEAEGNLVGGKVYTLDTNGVTANKDYLIVSGNSGYVSALTNNNGTAGGTTVSVSNSTITVEDDSKIAWQFSGSTSGTVENNGRYLYPNNGSLSLNTSSTDMTITLRNNSYYRISHKVTIGNWWNETTNTYYLRYNNRWTGSTNTGNVYLYELTSSSAGEAVTFSVDKGSLTLAPEATDTLTATVTLATGEVEGYDISWESTDDKVATVSNGTITAVADGNAIIKVTLSAVNGTAMQDNITLQIPVTVASRQLDDSFTPVLTGNDPVTTRVNVEPDFSKIKLEVKFKDSDEHEFITVENGLVIEGYDISKVGFIYATISYMGVEYGTVLVTVEGNPYEGVEDADPDNLREYPEDGAVRIDKNATQNADYFKATGLTHVELDVAGVSVKTGVDAVLTIDISNSMAWETGTKTDNFVRNKLTEVMESVVDFATIFLADNEDGTPTENTITIVTFAGKDSDHWNNTDDYIDSVRTLVSGTNDINLITEIANNTKFTGKPSEYVIQLAYANADGTVSTVSGDNRGDTNYDYAFAQTNQAIIDGNLGAGSRTVHVLFMTDGCASNFNNNYYRTKNVGHALTPNDGAYTGANYANGSAWIAQIESLIEANNGNIYANEMDVDGIYAVGFDMANGSFTGIGTWDASVDWEEKFNTIVHKVITDEKGNGLVPVTAASDVTTLKGFYTSLASELRNAGTNAMVTDIIGSDFTLQMASKSGGGIAEVGTQTITVTEYDLYTKHETDDVDLIGTRSGESNVLETVTFNDEGTKAYSDLINDGTENIMKVGTDGTVTITAHYFTYTKTPAGVETFKWRIGTITENEVTLGFNVYLKGALEGEAPKHRYYTNEEATLEYIDYDGKHATQTFPLPSVYWGGASTTVRFYLVNEKGEPVNRAGTVIPFANCIYVGEPVTIELNLNEDGQYYASAIDAAAVVPENYFLYDVNASYMVQTASSTDNSIVAGITPSEPSTDASKTTSDGLKQNGAQTTRVIDFEDPHYTWSIVGFGVRYDLTREKVDPLYPDQVVIDYGKAIQVNVLDNDPVVPTFTAQLVGFVEYNENIDPNYVQTNAGSATLTTTNGTYSIVSNQVQFQPTAMLSEVAKVYCVVKVTEVGNETNFHYRYEELDIIPATIMYYETDFATGVFATETTGNNWFEHTMGTSDNLQSCVAIGTDLYGYDNSYTNDNYYSNGTAYQTIIPQGSAAQTATFTFTGTGFDLISRTGIAQGQLKVEITGPQSKTVNVLNKSESNLELYQIPVVSVNDLPYGTYNVKVTALAAYTNERIPALNRGGEFIFDAVRIFDPIDVSNGASAEEGSDAAIAFNAYVADGEANNEIFEVRQELISQGDFDPENTGGIVFVDRRYELDENGEPVVDSATGRPIEIPGVDLSTYKTIGPNNEVYLTKDQAIGFYIDIAGDIPSSIHIGAKTADEVGVGENPAGLHVTTYLGETDDIGHEINKTIASCTAQYYDVLEGTTLDTNAKLYIIIENGAEGSILSITDLKVAYGDAVGSVSIYSDASVLDKMGVNSGSDEDQDTEDYNVVSAEFTVASVKRNSEATMIVTTGEKVETLTVQNNFGAKETFEIVNVATSNGQKVWTIKMKLTSTGNKEYTVVGYNAGGTAGSSANATILVKR